MPDAADPVAAPATASKAICGSGVQVFALHDASGATRRAARGVAVLYVHALNPYGFSHLRRMTHENVDLNRNFHDFAAAAAGQRGLPRAAPAAAARRMAADAANDAGHRRTGSRSTAQAAYQAAISGGQYEFPRWPVLRRHARRPGATARCARCCARTAGAPRRIAWIDLHTGLGPSGVGERIFAGRDDAARVARARAWWDGGGRTPVTSIYDGSSTSALLTGLMWSRVYDECPQAEYTGIALEYGTVPMLEVLQALRADHWLHQHPERRAGTGRADQAADAARPSTPTRREWKQPRGRAGARSDVAGRRRPGRALTRPPGTVHRMRRASCRSAGAGWMARALLAFALAAWSVAASAAPVVVGSKRFTESYVLGETRPPGAGAGRRRRPCTARAWATPR